MRSQAKIIWVAAPGGSGKTTLISSYIKEFQLAHCWYQVDEDDRDLSTFFHYLGLSGKRAAPRRKKSIPKLTQEYHQAIPIFTRQFFGNISSMLKNHGVIVLDNFHVLPESSPIFNILPIISGSLPENVSLIIVSRHLPPSSLMELTAKRELNVIDVNNLKFSEEEWVSASLLFGKHHDKKTLQYFHKKLDGWIAGLILLPKVLCVEGSEDTNGLGVKSLDEYIGEQFIHSLSDDEKELLLEVCYMPYISISATKLVSCIPNVKKILDELVRKNMFILQQGNKGFTLHPLMREYFQKINSEKLTSPQLYRLRYLTAQALLNEKEFDSAAELFMDLQAWEELVGVTLSCASLLYNNGRTQSLQRYLTAIPRALFDKEPWLLYWCGKLAVYNDVSSALNIFNVAIVKFMEQSDVKGVYVTWCAAVPVICSTLIGGDQLVSWINKYCQFVKKHPKPPPELYHGYVDAILLQAYYCSGLQADRRISLHNNLANIIDNTIDPLERLHLMSSYVHVSVLSGITERDQLIIEKFESQLDELKDNSVLYLSALTFCSLSAGSYNNYEKVLEFEFQALDVSRKCGVNAFDCHIYAKIVLAALGLRKHTLARQYYSLMKEGIKQKDRVYQSLYLVCTIAMGTYSDETSILYKSKEYFFGVLESIGFPPFILHAKLFYIYYLCVNKNADEALALRAKILDQVEQLKFPAQVSRFYMIYAKIYFDIGEKVNCNQYLKKSLLVANQNNLITYANWHPELMAWACEYSISHNIEISYVKRFIGTHYGSIPRPNFQVQQWPWFFRVSTFGGFELIAEYKSFNQRQQVSKSIEFLKLLVKTPNKSVRVESLKKALCINENSDKSSQLLDTQLHRLRKMLGNDAAILRKADTISLNLQYFWVDVLEFEALRKINVSSENAIAVVSRLQELYKGEYLPDDESIEAIAYRERYRNIYLATLFRCMDYIAVDNHDSIVFCQNALVHEPLSEPLYRRLISLYLARDNYDMAEVTLQQCKKLVKDHLDCDISVETLSLLDCDS